MPIFVQQPKTVDYDWLIKVVIVGESGVGKSCILQRYCDGSYSGSFISTIGVDFKFKHLDVHDKRIRLQIWDTAGQERFRFVSQSFYRGAHAVVIVYDCTDKEALNKLGHWIDQAQRYAPKAEIVILANKVDSEAKCVSDADGRRFAASYDYGFYESSAKLNRNIDEPFAYLTERCLQNRGSNQVTNENWDTIQLSGSSLPSRSGSWCC